LQKSLQRVYVPTTFISLIYSSINADDNGTYNETRNTQKFCRLSDGKTVHEDGDLFFINEKDSQYLPAEEVVAIHRHYYSAKSFPLKKTIVSVCYPVNGPRLHHVAVIYKADKIEEYTKTAESKDYRVVQKNTTGDNRFLRCQ